VNHEATVISVFFCLPVRYVHAQSRQQCQFKKSMLKMIIQTIWSQMRSINVAK